MIKATFIPPATTAGDMSPATMIASNAWIIPITVPKNPSDGAIAIMVAGDMSPAVVAGGMKVALITTVGGLIVAVILQIFFNYILSQVESLTIDMEDASISLMDILVKYQSK